ncbi:MAG TPA: hypothetical protein VNN73_21595 [Blastocatellia bacterium]|nr:hypothetical protein [Blastocatellia bacterium]
MAAVIMLICAHSPTRTASARGKESPRLLLPATPAVSLGDGQTFQVTYLNTGSNPFEIIPCIFDGDGAHLKTGDPVLLLPARSK